MNKNQARYSLVCSSPKTSLSQEMIERNINLQAYSCKVSDKKTILTLELTPSKFNFLKEKLPKLSTDLEWNLGLFLESGFIIPTKLAVFDMDSTLINAEVIDELAVDAGVGEKVKAITEKAMRGEINFDESLKLRVQQLQNLPESILQNVYTRISFNPGVEEAIQKLHLLGVRTALVSGGFLYFARLFSSRLKMDYAYANELDLKDEKLTGRVNGEILNSQKKADLLKHIALKERLDLSQVCAIGDGANDLEMMRCAGKSVAYFAKPKVQLEAGGLINTGDMMDLFHFLHFEGQV